MPKNNHYTLSFEDAKKIVHSYGFKTTNQWETFAKSDKRPKNIPKSPRKVYGAQWKGIADWLGKGKQKEEQTKKAKGHRYIFLPYEKAKAYVQQLQIKSHAQYRLWSKTERPNYIPAHADEVYRNEFEGWPEYLGYNAVQPQQMPDLFVENAEKEISQKPVDEPIVLPQLPKLHYINKMVELMEAEKKAAEIHAKYESLTERLKMFDDLAKECLQGWRNMFVNFLVKSKFADDNSSREVDKFEIQKTIDELCRNPVTHTLLISFATEFERKFFCNPRFNDETYESWPVEDTVEMLDGRGWRWVDYYEGRTAMVSNLLGLQMDIHEKQSEEGDYMIVDRIEFHLCNVPLQ